MTRSSKVRGYILKKKDLPYKDQVVTIYTKQFGKIVLIAKGIRTARSKRAGHIQTGSLIEFEFIEKSGLSLLTHTTLISGFTVIRDDYRKTRFLFCFLFVVDKLLPELQEDEEVFSLLHQYVLHLSLNSIPQVQWFNTYLNRLMQVLGYASTNQNQDSISFIEQLIDEKIPIHDIM